MAIKKSEGSVVMGKGNDSAVVSGGNGSNKIVNVNTNKSNINEGIMRKIEANKKDDKLSLTQSPNSPRHIDKNLI